MPTYTFTLILKSDPTLDQVDRLYGRYNDDIVSGVRAGVPYLECRFAAPSFEQAVGPVAGVLADEGIQVVRIEVVPEGLPAAA